jgi:hypothetical protein
MAFVVDENLLPFRPRWFVPVDAGDERWIDIEFWLDLHVPAGAALGDDRVYFVNKDEAERFARVFGCCAKTRKSDTDR